MSPLDEPHDQRSQFTSAPSQGEVRQARRRWPVFCDAQSGWSGETSDCPLVNEVRVLLTGRFAEHWTVSAVAEYVNRDRSYLSRLFKRRTGVTVHQFLVRQRLRHAEGLIREGEKIEVAALLAGFRSRRAFYRVFSSRHGVTPSTFRRTTCAPSDDERPAVLPER